MLPKPFLTHFYSSKGSVTSHPFSFFSSGLYQRKTLVFPSRLSPLTYFPLVLSSFYSIPHDRCKLFSSNSHSHFMEISNLSWFQSFQTHLYYYLLNHRSASINPGKGLLRCTSSVVHASLQIFTFVRNFGKRLAHCKRKNQLPFRWGTAIQLHLRILNNRNTLYSRILRYRFTLRFFLHFLLLVSKFRSSVQSICISHESDYWEQFSNKKYLRQTFSSCVRFCIWRSFP